MQYERKTVKPTFILLVGLPEKANTWNVGFVLSPRFLPALNVSADFFRIDVKDVISTFGTHDIFNLCFQGQQQFCDAYPNAEIFFNVTNVFDRWPLLVPETGLAANSTYSDLLGGAFRVGAPMEMK